MSAWNWNYWRGETVLVAQDVFHAGRYKYPDNKDVRDKVEKASLHFFKSALIMLKLDEFVHGDGDEDKFLSGWDEIDGEAREALAKWHKPYEREGEDK